MARSLGMRVTAEGVEKAEQALALQAIWCDRLEGFHFSLPVPAQDVPGLLSRHWPLQPAGAVQHTCAGADDVARQRTGAPLVLMLH